MRPAVADDMGSIERLLGDVENCELIAANLQRCWGGGGKDADGTRIASYVACSARQVIAVVVGREATRDVPSARALQH